jgi:hypothetical protein
LEERLPDDGPSIDDFSLDELGDQICEHAAHIAAATYRWLRLVAAFDRRRGWAEWGCRSCAHWLNWKCGLDLRSAREKVRVAHALTDLPLVSEAFARGEISYSKVRAITRIATPETEAELLMFARHGTTNHVEKIVRGYRRCAVSDQADAYDRRYLEVRYDDDGSVVIRARMTPEEGAIVLEALRKAAEEARAVRHAARTADDGSAEPPLDQVDGLVAMARRELAGEKAAGSSADRYTVMLHVDASVLAGGDGACHIEGGSAVSLETVRRLTCDGSLVLLLEDGEGNVLDVGRKTRTIPTAIRRALKSRDGGCRFPGCPHAAFVDGHHIKPWSEGGETSLGNLVLLCSFHHRQVHDGVVRVGAEPDGRFTFYLRDGRVIETAAMSVEPGGVERRNTELGLSINASTPVPRWYGDKCNYGVAVEGLLRRNGLGDYPRNGSAEPPPTEPAIRFT